MLARPRTTMRRIWPGSIAAGPPFPGGSSVNRAWNLYRFTFKIIPGPRWGDLHDVTSWLSSVRARPEGGPSPAATGLNRYDDITWLTTQDHVLARGRVHGEAIMAANLSAHAAVAGHAAAVRMRCISGSLAAVPNCMAAVAYMSAGKTSTSPSGSAAARSGAGAARCCGR